MAKDTIDCRLPDEIIRIINSPYPASLKSLHDIVLLDQDGAALSRFATANSCKMEHLASCVSDQIDLRPFTADLLDRLCRNDVFRSRLLTLQPGLLELLLRKCLSGEDTYFALSMTLLSRQLPASRSLPASAEAFFTATIKRSIRSPAEETLSTVYDLLTGACSSMPEIMSSAEWAQLQAELFKVIKSSRTIQDQSMSLLCIGILHRLSQGSDRRTANDASLYFQKPKIFKTLSLAALQAVWITKSSSGVTFCDAQRKLDIVIDIFAATTIATRAEWTESPEGQSAVYRLVSQSLDSSLSADLRLKIFLLASRLRPDHTLSLQFNDALVELLGDARSLRTTARLEADFTELLCYLADASRPVNFFPLLFTAVQKAKAVETENVGRMTNISILLSSLKQAAAANSGLCSQLLSQIDQGSHRMLVASLSNANGVQKCTMDKSCELTQHRAHEQVIVDLAVLFVTAALNAPKDSRNEAVAMAQQLLPLLAKKSLPRCPETFSRLKIPQVAIIEQLSSDSDGSHGSWRDRIDSYTHEQRSFQNKSLSRLVSDICGDLERRCDSAEQPYREALARAQRLESELANAIQDRSSLETQVVDLEARLRDVEEQNTDREEDSRSLQTENEKLIERISSLEAELAEARKSATAKVAELNAEHKVKEFELRAYLSEVNARAEDAVQRMEEIKTANKNAIAEHGIIQQELSGMTAANDKMRSEFETCQQDRTRLFQEKESIISELAALRVVSENAAAALDELRSQYSHLETETETASIDYRDQLAALKAELSQLKVQFDEERAAYETLKAEARSSEHEHARRIDALIAEAKMSRENWKTHKEEAVKVMQEQEAQIEELNNIVQAKEEEIAEFRLMRQTLAAAIGQPQERKHPRKSVHYAPPMHRSPVARRRSQRLTEQTPDADASFDSAHSPTGSTPKRAKAGKPFKAPACTMRLRGTPQLVKTPRAALGDVSAARGNRSPARRTCSIKSAKAVCREEEVMKAEELREEHENPEDMVFGSEIFTSTPFTPGAATAPPAHDDTTTLS